MDLKLVKGGFKIKYLNKRKVVSLVLLITLLINIPRGAYALNELDSDIILNGHKLSLDVKPVAVEGRIYVPLRAILEDLGMDVKWYQASQTVVGRSGTNIIQLPLNHKESASGKYNGVPFFNENAPHIALNGRTLIPVRSIAILLGLNVEWDSFTNNVILTDSYKRELSIREAYDILKNESNCSNTFIGDEYDFLPFGGYAIYDNYILDNYYVFSAKTFYISTDKNGNIINDYTTWGFNYCVNKQSGDVKTYIPKIHSYMDN